MKNGRVTEADILAAFPDEPDVVPRKIERWRKSDLIPRPVKERRKLGRGFDSWYPPETLDQVRALLRLREITDDTHDLRVMLWLAGYPVPFTKVRESLTAGYGRGAKPFLNPIPQEYKEPEDYADALATDAERKGRGSPMGGVMRSRLPQKQERQAALFALSTLMLGKPWTDVDTADGTPLYDVAGRMLGLRQEPFLATETQLTAMFDAGIFSASAHQAALIAASDRDIEVLKPLMLMLIGVHVLALDASGMAHAKAVEVTMKSAATLAATAVVAALHMQRSGHSEDVETLVNTVKGIGERTPSQG